ncbi:MAG TPA: chemotaxis protein CheB [Thermoanaerobaculia bacterium]|nr:chemotaxis protein CheB [Thermoanaerobaculia bacterium]
MSGGAGGGFDLVVMGASLGGLDALGEIFSGLPASFPAAVAVVQHRRADSSASLAALFAARTPLPVHEAEDREPILPGTVYLAPPNYHLLVERGELSLSLDPPVLHARPSIDVLFESAADAYERRLVAVLLTGASRDGAAGIAAVAARGGLTVVQDPDGALSPVAPRAALERTTVRHVLPVPAIAPLLTDLLGAAVSR